jgi:hypothetical protein
LKLSSVSSAWIIGKRPGPAPVPELNVTEELNITVPRMTVIANETTEEKTDTTTSFTATLPFFINDTTADAVFSNDTYDYPQGSYVWLKQPPKEKRRRFTSSERQLSSIEERDDPPRPPRDRTLADHMENYGENLPECYKKCMRSEDGKASIHMGKVSLTDSKAKPNNPPPDTSPPDH